MHEPIIEKSRFSLLWFLPLIALGIGLYLAYEHLSSMGPRITITFKTAEGLEAKKTRIRFKDLDIGTLTDVELSKDRKSVIATAQMLKTAAPLLTDKAKFWVVKPQVSAAGVRGLTTLISGSYIAIDPGIETNGEHATDFVALDDPPLTRSSEPGLRIRLATNDIKGLQVGSPLYYRGFQVGQVEQIKFDDRFDHIHIDAFIDAPYDKLINDNSKFWNASGFDFAVTSRGVQLRMQSLQTLALGGIGFSTPISLLSDKATFNRDTVFPLYASQQAIRQQSGNLAKEYYVVYFKDNIGGLQSGAPVVFNGIDIGEVIEIRLLYDERQEKAVIPVLIALEPERIDRVNRSSAGNGREMIAGLVANGLRASLETTSLITGEKRIELNLYPEDIGALRDDHYSSYQVLPSHDGNIDQIAGDVSAILAKLRKLPFDDLLDKANNLIDQAGETITPLAQVANSAEIRQLLPALLKRLERTLGSVQSAGKNADTLFSSLDKEFATITKQLENTLYGLSPDASLYYKLDRTLEVIQQTAKSVDRLAKKINEKPNA